MLTFTFILQMLGAGVGVGLLSGALGLGGGILMLPAFMTFAGLDPQTAKGTSLFIIIFVALVNAWRQHHETAKTPWRLAATLGGGSIAGSYAGAYFTSLDTVFLGLPVSEWVLWLFLALLILLALRTFFLKMPAVHEQEVQPRLARALTIGLVTGVVAGATGTGGGAVLVPLALMAAIVSNTRVVLLSNMVMVATSISGSVAHMLAAQTMELPWLVGQVYLPLVPLVFLGAQVGSPLGRWLNNHITLRRRRLLMGVLLAVIAVRLLYRLLNLG